MSQEIRLPAELAACEALLAAHALPACGIDRDSLLYRAGWEAALAHIGATGQCAGGETDRLAGTLESPLAKGRDRGGISRSTRAAMAWSAASAALAASIAVAATLALRPPRVVEVAAQAQPAAATVAQPQPQRAAAPAAASDATRPPVRLALPRPGVEAGLLRLRQQALVDVFDDYRRSPAAQASAGGGAAPKTIRELMDEMLPPTAVRSAQLWPWSRTAPGDSI